MGDYRDGGSQSVGKEKRGPRLPFHVVTMANELAIANVHGDFKTETHFGNSWLGPHNKSPLNGFYVDCSCASGVQVHHVSNTVPACRKVSFAQTHEKRLMIFFRLEPAAHRVFGYDVGRAR